jgi:pilus assembly protein CpaE
MMEREDVLICITDDIGIRVWLERTLDGAWPVEFVAAWDLSRASRLVEATRSRFVMVAADENEPEKALRIIAALSESGNGLSVVSVARRLNQGFLLQSMRAGARDCFIASSDGEEIRGRIRQLLHNGPGGSATDAPLAVRRKITLVTSASPMVDARLFTQSLAFALNQRNPQARILALDTAATGRYVFYLDSHNRLTFEHLLRNPESLDENLIETALEEYAPNLRLLAGSLSAESTGNDRNADMLIAVNQLAGMFDHVVINVDPAVADFWIAAVGLYARDLVMLIHPIVEQAHAARECLDSWRGRLPKECRQSFLLDCHEPKGSPSLGALQRAVGIEYLGALPLDWQNRLMAINAGLPMHKLPSKATYQRRLEDLLKRYDAAPSTSKLTARRGLVRTA